jgi:hypothetical protein
VAAWGNDSLVEMGCVKIACPKSSQAVLMRDSERGERKSERMHEAQRSSDTRVE